MGNLTVGGNTFIDLVPLFSFLFLPSVTDRFYMLSIFIDINIININMINIKSLIYLSIYQSHSDI